MNFVYRVYGLNVASSRHLPYLTCAPPKSAIDVYITFVAGHPRPPMSDGFFYFWYPPEGGLGLWTRLKEGYAEYTISVDGRAIRIAASTEASLPEILRYVTGVSFGAALRFQGVLCLHASAVKVKDSALIFAGPSHAGKSSLSAAFHRRGHPLISEDVIALDRRDAAFFVRPGYAGIRLYPETLKSLYGPDAVTDAIPVDHKVLHRLGAIPTAPCPAHALYLLAPRNPKLSEPRITPLDPTNAILVLLDQLYLHRFAPKELLARDFPRLGELVQRVPVYVLERPDTLSCLDTTIDLLLEQQDAATADYPELA